MSIEAFSTFIFVSAVLLVKDKRSGNFSAAIDEARVGFFGCALIALSLTGMILLAGPSTGASLNPAISYAQTELEFKFMEARAANDDFWRVYIFGPLAGAVVAGLCSMGHTAALEDHGPMTKADKEAAAAAASKKEAEAQPLLQPDIEK